MNVAKVVSSALLQQRRFPRIVALQDRAVQTQGLFFPVSNEIRVGGIGQRLGVHRGGFGRRVPAQRMLRPIGAVVRLRAKRAIEQPGHRRARLLAVIVPHAPFREHTNDSLHVVGVALAARADPFDFFLRDQEIVGFAAEKTGDEAIVVGGGVVEMFQSIAPDAVSPTRLKPMSQGRLWKNLLRSQLQEALGASVTGFPVMTAKA